MLVAGNTKFNGQYALLQGDGLSLPFASQSFDLITVAFGVRNFERLDQGLAEFKRVLKPGGRLLVLEFGQPSNAVFGALFGFYSRFLMPLIGGILTGNRAAYAYLPRTAAHFPCGESFVQILEEAKFSDVHYQALTYGIAYAYSAKA